jgi:hypothetical protein
VPRHLEHRAEAAEPAYSAVADANGQASRSVDSPSGIGGRHRGGGIGIVGQMVRWPVALTPQGWLECNGATFGAANEP